MNLRIHFSSLYTPSQRGLFLGYKLREKQKKEKHVLKSNKKNIYLGNQKLLWMITSNG